MAADPLGPEEQPMPEPSVPDPELCESDASDPSLPGVIVHLEADSCVFSEGQGGQFRYSVEFGQMLDFTTVSSNGGCGLCYDPANAETWLDFTLQGSDARYCPECAIGCCLPTEAMPASVAAQTVSGTIDWPGLQWDGPSDLGIEPEGAFPPGDYTASLTLALPGLGQVTARLPVQVLAAP
jgi:hypothetical protein